MKIFLVFQKEDEKYDTLPKDAEIIPLFKFIKGNPNIDYLKVHCQEVLDTANVETDFIVFNGPSYLCALAGYIWFTQENRVKMNFYSYNKTSQSYCIHTNDLE